MSGESSRDQFRIVVSAGFAQKERPDGDRLA